MMKKPNNFHHAALSCAFSCHNLASIKKIDESFFGKKKSIFTLFANSAYVSTTNNLNTLIDKRLLRVKLCTQVIVARIYCQSTKVIKNSFSAQRAANAIFLQCCHSITHVQWKSLNYVMLGKGGWYCTSALIWFTCKMVFL
jgi:hypothetical protein